MKYLFVFIGVILIGSCNSSKVTQANNQTLEDSTIVENEVIPKKEIVELVLRYSSASNFGLNSVFSLEAYSDGSFVYIGKENVIKKGVFGLYLKNELLNEVYKKADNIKFFLLDNYYPINGKVIDELPTKKFYLKVGIDEKSIIVNNEIPLELKKFELFLLDIIENETWINIER